MLFYYRNLLLSSIASILSAMSDQSVTTFATSQIFLWSIFLTSISLCSGGCINTERDALLQFKSGLSDPSNRLSDWISDTSDCCKWTGVVCHNVTFHVLEFHLGTLSPEEYFGPDDLNSNYTEYEEYYNKSALGGKVSSSLLQLKHLSYLDLSYSNFGGVPIPKFIGSMRSLRYLNFSNAGFGGIVPPQLGNLSNLIHLNLASMSVSVENLDWISSLTSLEYVDLSGVDLSQSFDWFKAMNSLHSMVELRLSGCGISSLSPVSYLNFSSLSVLDLSLNSLSVPIPNLLQNLTSSLRVLDLSGNSLNSSIPTWLYDFSHLQFLNLGFNYLKGKISSRIGNLTSLVSLELLDNDLEFEQGIPKSFKSFCNLRILNLSFNKLNQKINEILQILSSECVSKGLEALMLGNCQLHGHLTDDIRYFKNLTAFNVYHNQISGPIPLSLAELTSLKVLDLSNNYFNGTLPLIVGRLKALESIDISNNNFEGEISELHFVNVTGLLEFVASGSGKKIEFRVSPSWVPPLRLQRLALGSCHIGSQFPTWVRLLKHLTSLDLSRSGISSLVPLWFWDTLPNYEFLNISRNQIHGFVPNIDLHGDGQVVIDLSSNNFSGALPHLSSNVRAADFSNNSFSGSIFNFLCNKTNKVQDMEVLNLEGNLLSGEIPNCWGRWKSLVAIKLSNNLFSGHIPDSISTLSSLEALHLRNNNLIGEIPSSIQNCTKLFMLDLSQNNLVGEVQPWIRYGLSSLSILSLHANKFEGYLPEELCRLVSLRILDLSHNSFSGSIPSCFSNFTEMAKPTDSSGSLYANAKGMSKRIMVSALLTMKGKLMEYSTILGLVRSIDLSVNNLSGEIPNEITTLSGLLSLNLSHNGFSGRIPVDIGDMRWLEVIDLSRNRLSGEIPESMSRLHSLSVLNLSFNHLSGKIPLGTQLQSFDQSSFVGNRLCGFPLNVNCSKNDAQPGSQEAKNEDEVNWFYVSMAIGFHFAFGVVVGYMILKERWKDSYFSSVNSLWDKCH